MTAPLSIAPSSPAVVVPAPAKINLALHVVGRRPDGYHRLDMLVAFARTGDVVTAAPGAGLSLALEGPFAVGLATEPDNLVLRAARALADAAGLRDPGACLTLEKALPVASGIGGGSADAAATLVALDRLWGTGFGPAGLAALAERLGADVPMCVHGRTARVGGIGEIVEPAPDLPPHGLVLVNPGIPVATPAVFARLEQRENPPLPALPARFADVAALAAWLAGTRNDLEAAATGLVPAIGMATAALRAAPGCRFARMSGSGATVFGLFDDAAAAGAAAGALRVARPDWWVVADP